MANGSAPLLSWRALLDAHAWRPIPGCPGRHVLTGGRDPRDPAALVGAAPAPLRRCAARDPVAAVPLAEGGLISYQHEDGAWTHTLCDPDGFTRKLRQLGLDEEQIRAAAPR